MGMGKVVSRCTLGGIPVYTRDATANDSDKSFTVPANKRWRVTNIYVNYVATATVGNRQIRPDYQNSTPNTVVQHAFNGANVTAGTTLNGNWSIGMPVVHSATSSAQSLADAWLPAGYIVRVFDTNAVDAAADDMIVVLFYEEQDV